MNKIFKNQKSRRIALFVAVGLNILISAIVLIAIIYLTAQTISLYTAPSEPTDAFGLSLMNVLKSFGIMLIFGIVIFFALDVAYAVCGIKVIRYSLKHEESDKNKLKIKNHASALIVFNLIFIIGLIAYLTDEFIPLPTITVENITFLITSIVILISATLSAVLFGLLFISEKSTENAEN